MTVIGIDLGTTNCVIAYCNDAGVIEIIQDHNERLVPSCVSFVGNARSFGHQAKKKLVRHPDKTVYGVKRLLGRKFSDADVQCIIGDFSFKVENVDEVPTIPVDVLGEKKKFQPVQISGFILGYLKQVAERTVQKVTGSVITVPAYFNDAQRSLTREPVSDVSGPFR